ncbi:twin-arginine translocase TatA/TatE family subunit [Actinotalea sp. BY-33]|uniref:Twin-arginine translocase TatA/TatE family subunit n=1 Tax=Actinotalea soli TaxID=2819234 RepID=A0A939LQ22_9CELL|nr:twin-arginine translocase TatA/TatE family subunit [Actinotalea soli]MBO1751889.1 twin-arginine translocase TatA/TatE family subunit [Actinotalea soli]
MFGINGAELVVLLVVGLLVVGPERLPRYAEQLGTWVRSARGFVGTAKERVAAELGEEAEDVDWASLDPRRYDPRRIVREALLDDPAPPAQPRPWGHGSRSAGAAAAVGAGAAVTAGHPQEEVPSDAGAPFDDEAT